MTKVLWLVGEPGIGKTSIARELVEPDSWFNSAPKWTVGMMGNVAAAGHYTGTKFDGADTVPYNGVAAALSWWRVNLNGQVKLTIFDGDRFSHEKAVDYCDAAGAELHIVHLANTALAAARREARGGGQNASWVKGRATKATRFAERFADRARVLQLDPGERPPSALAEDIVAFLSG